MPFPRRGSIALAAMMLGCGGTTEDAPCAECTDASSPGDGHADSAESSVTDTLARDSSTDDTRSALGDGGDADVDGADACFRYSETATCCEGSVSYGPELTKCPGVTCRVAYRCERGTIYEDHDDCFFARCDTGVDTADVADSAETLADDGAD